MRTIDKILMYNFTPAEKAYMVKNGILNGCGGKGANIEKKMKAMIELLPGYDEKYKKILFLDLQEICGEHDWDFNFQHGFLWSNYQMARKVFLLLHWGGFMRFFVALTLFLLLSTFGYKYYVGKH